MALLDSEPCWEIALCTPFYVMQSYFYVRSERLCTYLPTISYRLRYYCLVEAAKFTHAHDIVRNEVGPPSA